MSPGHRESLERDPTLCYRGGFGGPSVSERLSTPYIHRGYEVDGFEQVMRALHLHAHVDQALPGLRKFIYQTYGSDCRRLTLGMLKDLSLEYLLGVADPTSEDDRHSIFRIGIDYAPFEQSASEQEITGDGSGDSDENPAVALLMQVDVYCASLEDDVGSHLLVDYNYA